MEPVILSNLRINDLFSKLRTKLNGKEDFIQEFEISLTNNEIPFSLLMKLHNYAQSEGESIYLHELISGSDICLPIPEKRERDPELEARCEKLRKEQNNKEYRKMVQNVDKGQLREDYFIVGNALKEMNRQMVSVFNFVVTVGGAFAFGYKAIDYSIPGDTFGLQLIGGLFLATIVFFADLYFLLKENG